MSCKESLSQTCGLDRPSFARQYLGFSPKDYHGIPYLEAVVLATIAVYLFRAYLGVRQLKALRSPDPPAALKRYTDIEEFKKTQAYQIDKLWLTLGLGVIPQVSHIASLLYMPWLLTVSKHTVAACGFSPDNEIPVSSAYFLLQLVGLKVIVLPQRLYSTFVIERKHGVANQTQEQFFSGLVKEFAMATVTTLVPLVGAAYILLHSGPYVAMYLWALLAVFDIVVNGFWPTLIAPLFKKADPTPLFERADPLPEGPLRDSVNELAGSLKFPLEKIFVVDGSQWTGHCSAYTYGFFKNTTIVLRDTLVDQCSQSQVVAVVAHELGHWKLNHILKNLILRHFRICYRCLLFTFIRNAPGLFESFGFLDDKPVFMTLDLYTHIGASLNEVVGLLLNILSRLFEYQADEFAVNQGHSETLKEALVILDHKSRSSTNADAWYSAWYEMYPTLAQRLKAIEAAEKKKR